MGWWRRVEVAALTWVVSFGAADGQGIRTLVVDAVGSVLANVVTVIEVVTDFVTVLHVKITVPDIISQCSYTAHQESSTTCRLGCGSGLCHGGRSRGRDHVSHP